MGLFVPLRSAPRPPILAQIWIFLAQNLDNHVVVPPFLIWADILTVERPVVVLVKLVVVENPDKTLHHILSHNLRQGWSFSEIPSQAGQWELCRPGRVLLEQFGALWRF